MGFTYQDTRSYSVPSNILLSFSRSAIEATGDNIIHIDHNTGIVAGQSKAFAFCVATPSGEILTLTMILKVQVMPVNAQESTLYISSQYADSLHFTDVFKRNEKNVTDFYEQLDFIIQRANIASQS